MIGLLGFVAIGAAAWLGRLAAAPLRVALALWWLMLLAAHAPVAPDALGRFFGGSLPLWVAVGVIAMVVVAYRQMLRGLRAKAEPPQAPVQSGPFREAEYDRYARHLMLREIGGPGQVKLKSAKVLVVGAGGLGAPVLLYLAAGGVGQIGIVDDDQVENSNLQRQIIHSDARLGQPKVFSAETALKELNPFITIRPYHRRLDEAAAGELFAEYDLIIDGSDNFDTRYMVNRVAVQQGKPLIAGAMAQWEGQLSLYHPAAGGPCYQCIFPQAPAAGLAPSCAEAGVMTALPGVIGTMMATEAIKHITGAGETLRGRMVLYNALDSESRVLRLKPRQDCPICGGGH